MTQDMFEVSAHWMNACGRGKEAKTYPVIRSYMRGHLPFVDLDIGEGKEWTVCAEWRGKFI